MTVTPLRVNVFAGAANLPIFVSQTRGFFERQGLTVEIVNTRNSREQMEGLRDGEWQVVHTAPDNVFAWEVRTGAGLIAFMGGFAGVLSLYGQRDITSIDQLRGRAIGVDAPDTGFVYALQVMLQMAGLEAGDYSLEPIGGTQVRFEALRDGRTPATLLNPPFDLIADQLGLSRLCDHTKAFASYSTGVAGARRAWAHEQGDLLVAYIRAYVAGLTWLADPQHADAATDILSGRLGLERGLSRQVLTSFMDPRGGFLPAAAIDLDGMRTVLELRARMAGWDNVPPLDKFYDLTWYERAFWADD